MTRRSVLIVCCLFAFAATTFAQRGSKPDAITGTWTGEFATGERTVAITMELKLEAKNAVTGTFTGMPSPGDVKKGAYDPKTGALKLELGKTGEAAVLLTLDGTVAKGTASGRMSGEANGTFTLTRKS